MSEIINLTLANNSLGFKSIYYGITRDPLNSSFTTFAIDSNLGKGIYSVLGNTTGDRFLVLAIQLGIGFSLTTNANMKYFDIEQGTTQKASITIQKKFTQLPSISFNGSEFAITDDLQQTSTHVFNSITLGNSFRGQLPDIGNVSSYDVGDFIVLICKFTEYNDNPVIDFNGGILGNGFLPHLIQSTLIQQQSVSTNVSTLVNQIKFASIQFDMQPTVGLTMNVMNSNTSRYTTTMINYNTLEVTSSDFNSLNTHFYVILKSNFNLSSFPTFRVNGSANFIKYNAFILPYDPDASNPEIYLNVFNQTYIYYNSKSKLSLPSQFTPTNGQTELLFEQNIASDAINKDCYVILRFDAYNFYQNTSINITCTSPNQSISDFVGIPITFLNSTQKLLNTSFLYGLPHQSSNSGKCQIDDTFAPYVKLTIPNASTVGSVYTMVCLSFYTTKTINPADYGFSIGSNLNNTSYRIHQLSASYQTIPTFLYNQSGFLYDTNNNQIINTVITGQLQGTTVLKLSDFTSMTTIEPGRYIFCVLSFYANNGCIIDINFMNRPSVAGQERKTVIELIQPIQNERIQMSLVPGNINTKAAIVCRDPTGITTRRDGAAYNSDGAYIGFIFEINFQTTGKLSDYVVRLIDDGNDTDAFHIVYPMQLFETPQQPVFPSVTYGYLEDQNGNKTVFAPGDIQPTPRYDSINANSYAKVFTLDKFISGPDFFL